MISRKEVTRLNKFFALFLCLSVFLNVVTLVLFAAAFGLLPAFAVSKPVGIALGCVCVVLSSVTCFLAVRLNRK